MTPASATLVWPTGRLDFSAGCLVMGILNVTPDSFSDGGTYRDTEKAVARGLEMIQQGAAILDIGPESTRPGAAPVSADEQIRRAVPVIRQLRQQTDVPISIDTRNAAVAQAAIDAGANMLNDITALSENAMIALAVRRQVPVILMHMQGEPGTMQQAPQYTDVVAEVLAFLVERANAAQAAGIPKERIILDPGIGFGKTMKHNLQLIKQLDVFAERGYRLLVGTSRKRFLGQITGKENPADRVAATAATVTLAAMKGASIVRVHDVAEMVDVVRVVSAVQNAET